MVESDFTGLEVAVIGMAGKFPGANSIDELWANICQSKESIARFSREELQESGVAENLLDDPNYIPAKGVIANPEYFDDAFFNYTKREASLMDPQIRLLHEAAWHTLENAGYDPLVYEKRIGIFAGATANPIWHAAALSTDFGGLAHIVSDKDYICSRIANSLNLRGPAIFVQTACSTSLVAVHVACRSVLTGDCEMALAGGIGLTMPNKVGYLYQEGMINSSDGHCRAFDEKANGIVGGEGYGLVLLKPLKKALTDRDYIHAIIRGSAINNDGANKVSFAAPSLEGQALAIVNAHKVSKVKPETIGYVEAHGTGTYIGDPVEVKALTKAFGEQPTKQFCRIGSLKTNIGHLDHAAGVAGLIKAVMCLRQKKIPPTLHYNNPNPELELASSPFEVNRQLVDWVVPSNNPRRAAVNSLGIGGTNAYVILQEASLPVRAASKQKWNILLTSARNETSLVGNQRALLTFLDANQFATRADDLTYTLATGRRHFPLRQAYLFQETGDLANVLGESKSNPRFDLGRHEVAGTPENIVFMFPGQGTQFRAMFEHLYQHNEQYHSILEQCFDLLETHTGTDFRPYLYDRDGEDLVASRTDIAQPLLFSVEYALAQLLIGYGIAPTACVGHSLGEYVAACIAGVMTLSDALYVVSERGRLMQRMEPGEMISVSIEPDAIEQYVNNDIAVAAINGRKSVVLSGTRPAIASVKAALSNQNIRFAIVNADHGFHSQMVDTLLDQYADVLCRVTLAEPTIRLASNLTGNWITAEECVSIDYWLQHMRRAVLFSDNIETIVSLPGALCVEVGPGSVLTRLVKQQTNQTQTAVSMGKNKSDPFDDTYYLRKGIAHLWLAGLSIDWTALFEGDARRIPLPGYAFDGKRFDFGLLKSTKVVRMTQTEDVSTAGERPSPPATTTVENKDRSETELENVVIGVYKDTLGMDELAADGDFFLNGGDSYTAMIAIAKLHKLLNVAIPLSTFFEASRIDAIVYFLRSAEKSDYLEIIPTQIADSYPLSPAQLRLYIVQQTEIDNVGYNESLESLIIGKLDVDRLTRAFTKLVERHEALRTSFHVVNDEIVQVVHDSVSLEVSVTRAEETAVDNALDAFIKPFDLAQAPLFRAGVISVNEQRNILVVDFHHIIIDGVAMGVLFEELLGLYEGQALETLPIHYKDFAVWQNSNAYRQNVQRQRDYWLEKYSGKPVAPLRLPTDYDRPYLRTFDGASVFSNIDGITSAKIRRLMETSGTSLFMVLFAALNVLLARISSQDDITIGTVVAGRRHAALERVVGVFVNMLVIRSYPNEDLSFRAFLDDIKRNSLEAFENQEYQYEELIQELNLKRDPSRNSLFDVAFVLQNTADAKDEIDLGNVSFYPYIRDKGVAKFDLTLTVVETEFQGLHLKWDYSARLFKRNTIDDFAKAYLRVVAEVVGNMEVKIGEISIFDLSQNGEMEQTSQLADNQLADWAI